MDADASCQAEEAEINTLYSVQTLYRIIILNLLHVYPKPGRIA